MNNVKVYTKAEENLVKLTHKFKDTIFKPLIITLTFLNVPPNFIAALSASVVSIGLFVANAQSNPNIFITCLWVHFILDALDGPLSRFQGKASQSGAITDSIVDYIGVVSTAIFVSIFTTIQAFWLILFCVLYLMEIYNTFITSMLNSQLEYGARPRLVLYFLVTLETLTSYNYTQPVLLVIVPLMFLMVISSFSNIYKLSK